MPTGNKEKLNYIHGWNTLERKCSFLTTMWHVFCSDLGTPELPLLVLPGGLRSGVPLSSSTLTPCSTKLSHTALPRTTLRCTTLILMPLPCIPAFIYTLSSHMLESWHSSHAPNSLISPCCLSHSRFLLPLLYLAHLQKAHLQWRECSPLLQSRLFLACTEHRQELNNTS